MGVIIWLRRLSYPRRGWESLGPIYHDSDITLTLYHVQFELAV